MGVSLVMWLRCLRPGTLLVVLASYCAPQVCVAELGVEETMSSDEELAEVKRVVGSGSQRTALEGTERKQLLAPRGPGGDAQSSEDLGESLQLVETVLGGCPKYLGAVSKDSSVGLLVAVAQRLGELRVGSAADLLSLAERKLSQPNDDDDPGAT